MGTMFERSPSGPRLIVTCRKLGSSRRPIAPSVRKTKRPSEVIFRMSRLLSIHASTLCSNGRSISGGHISTLRRNFFGPCNALRSDMEVCIYHRDTERGTWGLPPCPPLCVSVVDAMQDLSTFELSIIYPRLAAAAIAFLDSIFLAFLGATVTSLL